MQILTNISKAELNYLTSQPTAKALIEKNKAEAINIAKGDVKGAAAFVASRKREKQEDALEISDAGLAALKKSLEASSNSKGVKITKNDNSYNVLFKNVAYAYRAVKHGYIDIDGEKFVLSDKVKYNDGKNIEDPKSDLIPSDFLYQPIAIEKDEHGYIYILSLGCYYGALMYTPEYEFMGFYGPNTVKSSALDTLSYLWDKLTSTEEKKTSQVKKLPYSFSDFAFDPEGFLVTTTGAVTNSIWSDKNIGQIKKISHNGANILFKRDLKGESSDSPFLSLNKV